MGCLIVSRFLILASKSPRRKELLQDLGLELMVLQSDVDETIDENDKPIEEKVMAIARKKARAVAFRPEICKEKNIVIASDTIVYLGEEILEKPRNRREAFAMLKSLSGKKHSVITATIIIDSIKEIYFQQADKTEVYFKNLDERIIKTYLDQNHYMDKAGSYGIQNKGELLIEKIEGDYFNVMGLSIPTIRDYFKENYNEDLSMNQLLEKHGKIIEKFKSDGDNNE